jgi:hypothetical protein
MMGSPIMVAIDDRVRRPRVKLILECSPADGTNAAVNWRDYGRSRWQLSEKITTIADAHVRGLSTFAGIVFFAKRTNGAVTSSEIGAKSFNTSYGSE